MTQVEFDKLITDEDYKDACESAFGDYGSNLENPLTAIMVVAGDLITKDEFDLYVKAYPEEKEAIEDGYDPDEDKYEALHKMAAINVFNRVAAEFKDAIEHWEEN